MRGPACHGRGRSRDRGHACARVSSHARFQNSPFGESGAKTGNADTVAIDRRNRNMLGRTRCVRCSCWHRSCRVWRPGHHGRRDVPIVPLGDRHRCHSPAGLAADTHVQFIHTPHDHVPNVAANPTIRSAAVGTWSSPSTWSRARRPAPDDIVSVAHTVTYNSTTGDADVIGIESSGVLRFSIIQTMTHCVATLLVLANGVLEIGTVPDPVPASVAAEIIIKDKPLNPSADPDQYGTGLVSIEIRCRSTVRRSRPRSFGRPG